MSAKPNGLTWAELANLRQPKTWTMLLHGEKHQSTAARSIRERFVVAEEQGLIWFDHATKQWALTDKGRAVVRGVAA